MLRLAIGVQEAIEVCYSLLGTVQHLWRKVPTEDDDDYIANPKPSGYQSLHTAVIGELPGRPSPLPSQCGKSQSRCRMRSSAADWAWSQLHGPGSGV